MARRTRSAQLAGGGYHVQRVCQGQRNSGAFGNEDVRRIEEAGTPAGSLLDLAPHPTSGLDVHCDGSTGNSLVDEAADFPGPQAQSIAGTVQLSR